MNVLDINQPIIVCRPALPKDRSGVMALTRTIWEGRDYVPQVWDEWLAVPEGWLAVAEYGGRIAGTCKLTRITKDQWWLEGLRVDPELQGRGIARRLHEYVLEIWEKRMGGVLRLATSAKRLAVQHLSSSTGFEQIGEYTSYQVDLPAPASENQSAPFQELAPEEVSHAVRFALHSGSLDLTGGLMDLGWQWAEVDDGLLAGAVKNRLAWWWRGGRGLLAVWIDEEPPAPDLFMVALLACAKEDLPLALQELRGLASQKGYRRAGWVAPMLPEAITALDSAGFQRSWESSLYLYALDRRSRIG